MLPAVETTDPTSVRARVTVLTTVKPALHLSGTEISISAPSRSLIHLALDTVQSEEGATKQRCIIPQVTLSELQYRVCRKGWRRKA